MSGTRGIGPSLDPRRSVDKWSVVGPVIDLVLLIVGFVMFVFGGAPTWATGLLLITIAAIPWRSS